MTIFALLFLALLSALIAYISLLPDNFRIARSTTIDASPEVIFRYVNDFHNWLDWSPWARLDPDMKDEYGGTPLGYGATYSWSGNKEVGVGRMEIVESRQGERVRIRLEFKKPFNAAHDVQFDLKPLGEDRTEVTWAMSGRHEFMGKAMHKFFNVDKTVGGQFDKGLADLKRVVESQPKIAAG
ncbi:MAG: SRPBCC family protein [Methylocystis sp.]|nr:SRPBCC family protein [Methylocystis sp.]